MGNLGGVSARSILMPVRLAAEPLEVRALPAAAFQTLPVLPFYDPAVLDHARAIFTLGQQLGRQTDVVLKIGDSNSAPFPNATPVFLAPLGALTYNPVSAGLIASHPDLLATLLAYRSGADSLAREGPAAFPGWTTQNVLAALTPQIAATSPGVALVMIGTNDVMLSGDATAYRSHLTQIVTTLTAAGVVPVLSTIPDNHYKSFAYHTTVMAFNQVVADVAGQYRVPLWNAWAALNWLPNQGLDPFGVHLTTSPNGGGSFWPADMAFGQNVRNLEALKILDWFRETVAGGPVFVAPRPTWQAMADTRSLYAVSRGAGFSPTVAIYDADTGQLVNRFLAFGASYGSGVRVATGDVNGDGFTDVVCATGGGTAGTVKVFSGKDGSVLDRTYPFYWYSGALSVAVGDANGDSVPDVVVGTASTGSGVRVYAGGSFTPLSAFSAFPKFDAGGVSVAVADVKGVGPVVAVGANGVAPVVRLFSAGGSQLSSFRVFAGAGFGVTIAAADLDGDGFDELAVARAVGAGPVRVFDPVTHARLALLAAGVVTDASWGLRLGTLRSPGGDDALLVGNSPGSRLAVRAFDDLTGTATQLPPDPPDRAYGIFVG